MLVQDAEDLLAGLRGDRGALLPGPPRLLRLPEQRGDEGLDAEAVRQVREPGEALDLERAPNVIGRDRPALGSSLQLGQMQEDPDLALDIAASTARSRERSRSGRASSSGRGGPEPCRRCAPTTRRRSPARPRGQLERAVGHRLVVAVTAERALPEQLAEGADEHVDVVRPPPPVDRRLGVPDGTPLPPMTTRRASLKWISARKRDRRRLRRGPARRAESRLAVPPDPGEPLERLGALRTPEARPRARRGRPGLPRRLPPGRGSRRRGSGAERRPRGPPAGVSAAARSARLAAASGAPRDEAREAASSSASGTARSGPSAAERPVAGPLLGVVDEPARSRCSGAAATARRGRRPSTESGWVKRTRVSSSSSAPAARPPRGGGVKTLDDATGRVGERRHGEDELSGGPESRSRRLVTRSVRLAGRTSGSSGARPSQREGPGRSRARRTGFRPRARRPPERRPLQREAEAGAKEEGDLGEPERRDGIRTRRSGG